MLIFLLWGHSKHKILRPGSASPFVNSYINTTSLSGCIIRTHFLSIITEFLAVKKKTIKNLNKITLI